MQEVNTDSTYSKVRIDYEICFSDSNKWQTSNNVQWCHPTSTMDKSARIEKNPPSICYNKENSATSTKRNPTIVP